MPKIQRALRARRLLGASLALVLLGSLIPIASVSAIIPPATLSAANANINADTTSAAGGSSTFTAIGGPTVTENAFGQIVPGGGSDQLSLNLAGAYVFDTVTPVTVTVSATAGTCGLTATSPATVGATTITTTLGGTATSADPNRCRIAFSGIRVKPTTGAVPNVGTITVGYTGTAAIAGFAGGSTFGTLTAVPGAASTSHSSFTTSPSDSTGGVAFGTQPTIHVADQFNNPIQNATVNLSVTPGTGANGAAVACSSVPLTLNTGDTTSVGCAVNLASAVPYRLRATTGSIFFDSSSITPHSGGFLITTGPAHHLVFTSYPAASTLTTLTPQPAVQVVDAGGNAVTSPQYPVTLAMTPLYDAQFTCTSTKTVNSTLGTGIATFAGCTETVAGATNYQLVATSGVLGSATSPVFNVTSGPAYKVAICWGATLPCITTPPTTITGGTVFPTQPVIRELDVNGNTVVTDSTTVVSLGILSGTPTSGGPGTLTCNATSGAVVNGVFALANCRINKAGIGYQLNATATGLISGQSTAFNVAVGTPIGLAFVVQPPVTATALAAFPSNVQVGIVDAGGNVVTTGYTASINLAITTNPAAGTLSCTGGTTVATTNGLATFTGCSINNQGAGYILTATAVAVAPVISLPAVSSNAFTVLAPAASITLSAPSVITWGDRMTITVHFGLNGGNKSFTIQVTKDGINWSNIPGASLTTDSSGNASFVYGPSDNRYYRVAFAGAPDLQAGTSNIVRTVVRQINLLRPMHSGYQTISHGTQIQFSSLIRPNRPELPQAVADFVVYQLKNGSWVKVLDRMVGVDRNPSSATYGKAVLLITFNTSGQFYVRSQAVPTTQNANSGWSALVRYTVI